MFCFDEMPCLIVGLHEGMFYKANDMPALLAEGGSRPACRPAFCCRYAGPPESRQRACPYCPRPLRCATGATCAAHLLRLCGPTHFAACRSVRTNGRIFEDDAVALCGATASPKRPPQAWAQGAKTGNGMASLSFFAACLIWISARGRSRPNSGSPPVPASPRVSAPAARGSGCGQRCRRTALHGGFNRSLQHTNHRIGGRSVANEAATQNLLFG
ncbi:hypothetical protein Ga0061062_11830 [Comamonas thiooxydans]|nr:hypothetical protein Ga0061062_11830 [Comamonas thiooxydans]